MNDSPRGRHRIGAVVRLTGVSAHALRAWERRYGALNPERTPAGDRLYSESDVRKLRLIKRLTEYGHSIGDIAELAETELEQLLEQHTRLVEPRTDHSASNAVERYLDALGALDIETAERVLLRAAISRDPRDFIQQFAEPILERIGTRWQTGTLCVANEHAASAMLRTHLGALLAELPIEPDALSIISATPAGERHEFGALFAAITAALGGYRAVYLGPDLPASEIALAARATGAVAVFVSVVAMPVKKARIELQRLCRVLAPNVSLFVGGSGAFAAARGIERAQHVPALVDLSQLLAVGR